jgi:hypothetical protein
VVYLTGLLLEIGDVFGGEMSLLGAGTIIYMFGVAGGIFEPFFLFYYSFLLIELTLIFIILKYRADFFYKFKKRFLIGSASLAIVALGIQLLSGSTGYNQEKEYKIEYNQKYEFNDVIKSDAKFIYLEYYIEYDNGVESSNSKSSIVVSKIDGSERNVLRTFDRNNSELHNFLAFEFISPKGSYFLADVDFKKTKPNFEKYIYKTSDLTPILDVCVAKKKLHESSSHICPEKCEWSVSEKYLTCQYDDESSEDVVLILFDVESKKYREVYRKAPFRKKLFSYGGKEILPEGFSWDDEKDKLYYDKNRKIYVLLNVAEFVSDNSIEPNIENFPKLNDCSNVTYSNKKIYCLVYANEVGIDLESLRIKNPNRDKYSMNDVFIISQDPYNKSNPVFRVINKYPLNKQSDFHPIDEKYIFYSDKKIFIDLESGRWRSMLGRESVGDIVVKEDKDNIFYYLTNEISGKYSMPVKYSGT